MSSTGPSQPSQFQVESALYNELEDRQRILDRQELAAQIQNQIDQGRAMKEANFKKAWTVRGGKTELEEWSKRPHQVRSPPIHF
jgi:hypothetical protein